MASKAKVRAAAKAAAVKSKRQPQPKRVAPDKTASAKRAEQAAPGEAVRDSSGRLLSRYKTDYTRNASDKCCVPGCNEPMHDSKKRRTGAKGACRLHYMQWIRARNAALEKGEDPPLPPNEV